MVIFIKIVQLLLSLSILVIFHELGHFTAAKIFKTRVEKFYLFFNPWFSLFKFKKGETEYGMGWLPLGGYVKIAGMIDESLDREQMKQPPQPWELRSKPAWQRLIIMLGGVVVNIIFAIVIYIIMLAAWGEQYVPTANMKYGITVDSLGYQMGLRNGDKILSVDHRYVDDYICIPSDICMNNAKTIQVTRNGQILDVIIPDGFITKLMKSTSPFFISVRFPFVIGKVSSGSPAKIAGIKENDHILGFNDSIFPYFDQFRAVVQQYKNKEIKVIVLRGKDTLRMPVKVSSHGTIGVQVQDLSSFFVLKNKSYNVITAIPAGAVKAFNSAWNYLKAIRLLFTQEKAYESVGGFISIGNFFPSSWDWQTFWSLTAFLSIILAIFNVFPIPALDGGYVIFLLYEIIFRRKPGDKFLEYAQIVGMLLLFGLLIFANLNDVIKLFK